MKKLITAEVKAFTGSVILIIGLFYLSNSTILCPKINKSKTLITTKK